MAEMEEEDCDAKRNTNHVTMDTISPCVHSTISPSQGDIASVANERRISLINRFNELTMQSTINDSEEDDAESDPKVATYTNNGNSPQKLFINQLIPNIIPVAISLIDQPITEDVAVIRETLEARQTVLSKEIVTNVACSGARIF